MAVLHGAPDANIGSASPESSGAPGQPTRLHRPGHVPGAARHGRRIDGADGVGVRAPRQTSMRCESCTRTSGSGCSAGESKPRRYRSAGIVGSPPPAPRHRWTLNSPPVRERNSTDWADERAGLPIDPETGPGWRLGVLPMTDGSTAISLEISHCLTDGMGAVLTIIDAIKGVRRELGVSDTAIPHQVARAEIRMPATALRSLPEVARTVAKTIRLAYRRRNDISRSAPPPQLAYAGDPDAEVLGAGHIGIHRSRRMGSPRRGIAGEFAFPAGRVRGEARRTSGPTASPRRCGQPADSHRRPGAGRHACQRGIAGQHRGESGSGDHRSFRCAGGDPGGLKKRRDEPDESLELLPLIPFVPKVAVKRGADVLFGFADLPVSCTNLGDLDPALGRV